MEKPICRNSASVESMDDCLRNLHDEPTASRLSGRSLHWSRGHDICSWSNCCPFHRKQKEAVLKKLAASPHHRTSTPPGSLGRLLYFFKKTEPFPTLPYAICFFISSITSRSACDKFIPGKENLTSSLLPSAPNFRVT